MPVPEPKALDLAAESPWELLSELLLLVVLPLLRLSLVLVPLVTP